MIPPDLAPADLDLLDVIADQHGRLTTSAPWLNLLKREALARAIRGTCAIEGFIVSVDDALAALNDEEPLTAGELAWRAVLSYRDATTFVLELAKESLQPGIDTLRALHFLIQRYDLRKWPGRWRPGDIFVHDGEQTVYVGPDAELVPGLMTELVDDAKRDDGLPLLVRAAMAHLNLVMIHPFKDGNGRMARCLQTLLLACGGMMPAPEFVSIEEYLGQHEQDYYRVLAEVGGGSWQPERDTLPWIRFCLTAHHRQALRVERRDTMAARLWVQAAEAIEDAGLPERCVEPLAFGLTGRVLRNSTYRQLVPDVSNNLASRDLNELVKAGLFEPIGEKRGRRYVPSDAMRLVAAKARYAVNGEFPVTGDPYDRVGARP